MSQTDGKKTEAAKILGIDTSTLYRKIQRYNLNGENTKKSDRPGTASGDE
jgi:DNA-binding NtrC family response regulator